MKITDTELAALIDAVGHCAAAQGELDYMEGQGEREKERAVQALESVKAKLADEQGRREFLRQRREQKRQAMKVSR